IDEAELQDAEIETPIDENAQQQAKIDELEVALAKEKEEYMFLMAEFDNFRKRTIKEKGEIIRNGAEKAMNELLPIIDDFERGIQASAETEDVSSVKEGIELIYNKFVKYLEKNGVKAIDTEGKDFDTELHEAVTTFPAPDDSLKGKIIDTVQKGYTLNDKVLRHSKVVVGQ
ncbi:MAG: nucleotide exchange factor GrpE, partial [Muribaculaceae bacterium]